VRSENIESNESKNDDRDENTGAQFGYNPRSQHSPQSSLMLNNNGYNNGHNNGQSSLAQTYSSSDGSSSESEKKDHKTVILVSFH